MRKLWRKLLRFLGILGPGVITGAADDDPSGIATYAQTGAQFGYTQLWLSLWLLPFQSAVQEACARIGAVTGKGLAGVIRAHYAKWILYAMVGLVVVANTINIGADIGAMAEAAQLVLPGSFTLWAVGFAVVMILLEIFVSYHRYSNILKWLTISLIAYPLTVFIVRQPWLTLLSTTLIPHWEWSSTFLFMVIGILGTTISPYMFFWQASEETEEEREQHMLSGNHKPHIGWRFIRGLRKDTITGMIFSQIGSWSIMVVGATVLHAHGVLNIRTAADAAAALEPLVADFPNAGLWAKAIFASGVVGLGLLSVPVLAGSAAYAVAETFKWRASLNLPFGRAHGFYGVIAVATLIGLALNFLGIDPMQALVYAAVLNGVVAAPLIFVIWLIARNKEIMGQYRSRNLSDVLLLTTVVGMSGAVIAMVWSLLH